MIGSTSIRGTSMPRRQVIIDQYPLQSLLDVGSGTGRAFLYLKDRPGLELKGIKPSQNLAVFATLDNDVE